MKAVDKKHLDQVAKMATVYVVEDRNGNVLDYGFDRKFANARRTGIEMSIASFDGPLTVRKWKAKRS
jgi:hypothetical protein